MANNNYCTLFNYNYLSRGLSLYESLEKVHEDFYLYIFAFDDKTYIYLSELNLKRAVIISLNEFEDEKLLEVKPTRSAVAYCWTCTPSVIRYALEKYKLPSCTYLDADMYFYSSTAAVFDELKSYSVGLTLHNYSTEYNLELVSGKYCVQFVHFKNSTDGMKALNWWRDECINWCYDRIEDGKSGDQKYLESFSSLFNGIHDIVHLGVGIAPWNIGNFEFYTKGETIHAKNNENDYEVIFFHFQSFKIDINKKIIHLGKWWRFSKEVMDYFYYPYCERILYYESIINKMDLKLVDFKLVKSNNIELFFYLNLRKYISRNKLVRIIYNWLRGKI